MTDKKVKSPKIPDLTALALKSPIKTEDVDLLTTDKATLKKINALKNVQLKMLDVESKFYDELHELECRYAKLYEPFYEKRKQIVTGEYEPTDEEGKWTLDELNEDQDEQKPIESNGEKKEETKQSEEKGIKNFWLETLQSFRITSEIIQEYDEPILSYLEDVRVRLFDSKPFGYVLEFFFAENPYFTNKCLTKTYELKTEVDPKDPFSFDGPDLEKAVGCKIDWKTNKNVTVKLIKKKLKSRNKKLPPKIVTKEEKQDSFFNFFDTPGAKAKSTTPKSPVSSSAEESGKNKQVALKNKHEDDDHDEEEGEDDEELYLIADFEIGQYLKEKIIPKAILYYTGEGVDDEFDDYDEDDEDEEDDDEENDDENDDDEDDDDDEEEDDEDDHGKKGKGGNKKLLVTGKGNKNGKPGNAKGGEPTPSECKQN